ncbi:MAG: hypothetical protein K9N49_02165, partial [Candidatus Marinimicrobia bacterium]|nr:hypothetical protein [Candidatus Neomarinimicrobiota bacterium]
PPNTIVQNPESQQALLNMDFSVPVSVPFDTPVLNATPRDVEDQMREWHGQLVRLRFTGRGDLQRLEEQPGYAEVVLWDRRGGMRCLLPALGLSWIRDIRPYHADRRRSVYGVVDAHRGVLRLIGRTQKTQMGNQPTLYSW